jgi:peptidyl-prolyl cis-trans isomerase D
MSPKNKEVPKHNPRTHLAKTKKQNKLLMISFIITGVVIIGLIGYGVLRATVLKNYIPVAVVNGQKIDNDYFEARVRWERNYSIEQYQLLVGNPQLVEVYQQQILQIETLLNNVTLFGEYVLNAITQDEVIAMKAKEMGIEVSDQEVDTFIEEFFNYFPEGTSTPAPLPTAYPTPTLSKTQEAILDKPTSLENEDGEAASAESEAEATLQPTAPTLVPGPTATAFTDAMFTDLYQSYLSDLNTKNISEKYLRKIFYHYLMNQKVTEAVIAEVRLEEEQVWARHILVNSEEEAKNVLERLITENWNDVALDASLDNSNKNTGGDLGWFPSGQMVPEFEEAVFELEIGKVSAPVETQFGWHIIQLVDRAILPLSEADYQNTQNIYYNEWLAGVNETADIKTNDVWKDIVPSDPNIP